MKYTLKIVNNSDYDKIAAKYPKKQRNRIKNSWGFSDTNRGVAFVRSRRRIGDIAGVAMHEVMELLADISPHDEAGIRLKGKDKVTYVQPPPPQYSQSPEDSLFFNEYWKNIAIPRAQEEWQIYKETELPRIRKESELYNTLFEPYLREQYALEKDVTMPRQRAEYDLWKNVFEPTSRQLGGILQRELARPISEMPKISSAPTLPGVSSAPTLPGVSSAPTLPGVSSAPTLPDVKGFSDRDWDSIWNKTRERVAGEYKPIEERTTRRLAASGALEQGAAQGLFKDIDLSKAKQIEDLAVKQAMQEWQEKKSESKRVRNETMQNMLYGEQFKERGRGQELENLLYGEQFKERGRKESIENLLYGEQFKERGRGQELENLLYGEQFKERERNQIFENLLKSEELRRLPIEDIFRFLGYAPGNVNPNIYQPKNFQPFTQIPQVESDTIFAQPITQKSKTSQWMPLLTAGAGALGTVLGGPLGGVLAAGLTSRNNIRPTIRTT